MSTLQRPSIQPTNAFEPRAIVALVTSTLLPIPFLSAFNKLSLQYPLDKLHYFLFQLVFISIVPIAIHLTAATQPPDFTKKTVISRKLLPQRAKENKAKPKDAPHKYTQQCTTIERELLALTQSTDQAMWNPTPLVKPAKPYYISIHAHSTKPFCFRIEFYAPTLAGSAFDVLADPLQRPSWDELTESTRIVEDLNSRDAIHYLRMKPVWPTTARDSLLISHIAKCDSGYLHVTQSIVDERVPEVDGLVRMEAGIAGQVVMGVSGDEKSRLGLEGDWSRIVQVVDGDLKGWIPKSVVKFVATQAMPKSLVKVNDVLKGVESRSESMLVRGVTEATREKRVVQTPRAGVSARSRLLFWIKIVARQAVPVVVAAITSLLINLWWRRR